MDSYIDAATLNAVNSFDWPHGGKTLQRRIIQGGLIRVQRAGGQRPSPPPSPANAFFPLRARSPASEEGCQEGERGSEEASVAPFPVVHSSVDREDGTPRNEEVR
uniref:Uncharacterized protein n=1 Tax=Oryza rufipogon TaxID=4529 RepID=A0A0E0P0H6_ORYRU